MIIPGFLIAWLTFPGVIFHEMGHQLMCILTRTQVLKVCYFRFGNPAGYVLHVKPTNIWKHLLIGFGPLFFNTTCGFLLGLLARSWMTPAHHEDLMGKAIIWLAVSVAMHSFPSTGDAASLWHALWHERASLLARMVGTPLVGLIYLGAISSVFWMDLVYGFAVAYLLPEEFVRQQALRGW